MKTIKLVLRFLSKGAPYEVNAGAPTELKDIWIKLLFKKSNIRFLILFLFTKLIWNPKHYIKYKLLKLQNKESIEIEVDKKMTSARIPMFYYNYFRLSKPGIWQQKDDYLYHKLFRHCLASLATANDVNILKDKIKFYSFCRANSIETPLSYDGSSNLSGDQNYPWQSLKDFIIKPTTGRKSKGFRLFKYDDVNNHYRCIGHKSNQICEQVRSFLEDFFSKNDQAYIIQEKIENHKFFNNICNGSLCVIRILSMVTSDNNIETFRPILLLPQNNMITADIHRGADAYEIDGQEGKILSLVDRTEVENQIVKNTSLPHWERLLGLVKDCHKLLLDVPLIGWDVAITPSGPSIIEGNTGPSLDIHQLTPMKPIINSDFYNLLMFHLRSKL